MCTKLEFLAIIHRGNVHWKEDGSRANAIHKFFLGQEGNKQGEHGVQIRTCIVDEYGDVPFFSPQALLCVRSKLPNTGEVGKVQPPALAAAQ